MKKALKTTDFLRRNLMAAVVVTLAFSHNAKAQEKDPVRIGLVTSQSGSWAQMGEETIRSAVFAIEEANAKGGVDGRKVEYQLADDESTPEGTRRNSHGAFWL